MSFDLITLKKSAEFSRTYKKGKKTVTPYFSVHIFKRNEAENEKENAPRFGFTLKKKTIRSAVTRNKMKRRLKEAVRCFLVKPEIQDFTLDYDVVITPFSSIVQANFQAVLERVLYVLNRYIVREAFADIKSTDLLRSA